MERVVRIIGIGLMVGMFISAVGYYQRTASGVSSEPTERIESVTAEAALGSTVIDRDDGDGDGPPPRYLAFTGGIRSGLYTVAGVAGSDDRDVSPGRRPSADYPPETDLVPEHSLATTGELDPGLYATAFGVRDCSYEIRRVSKSRTERVIGRDRLNEGRMLVSINEIEPDLFHASPQCGDWSLWSPLVEPLTTAGNGDYWVGDLASGTWSVPNGCIWEKVVGFRGAELYDVQDSAIGPRPLVVDDDTLGVRIRGCDVAMSLS